MMPTFISGSCANMGYVSVVIARLPSSSPLSACMCCMIALSAFYYTISVDMSKPEWFH
jgi:hypothetical protein